MLIRHSLYVLFLACVTLFDKTENRLENFCLFPKNNNWLMINLSSTYPKYHVSPTIVDHLVRKNKFNK